MHPDRHLPCAIPFLEHAGVCVCVLCTLGIALAIFICPHPRDPTPHYRKQGAFVPV